jgi:hypothetical protein
LLLVLLVQLANADQIAVDNDNEDRYISPEFVNTSVCAQLVSQLPLRVYSFKYDSQKGRRQLGVMGPDLRGIIPESVKLLPIQPFPNPDKDGPPIIQLRNYYAVDNNVLFFYNIGATQQLIKENVNIWESIMGLSESKVDSEELASVWAQFETDRKALADTLAARDKAFDDNEVDEATARASLHPAVATFGPEGAMVGDLRFTFDASMGKLTVPKIGGYQAAGPVDFAQQPLTNANIQSGTAAGLASVSAEELDVGSGGLRASAKAVDVAGDLHVGETLSVDLNVNTTFLVVQVGALFLPDRTSRCISLTRCTLSTPSLTPPLHSTPFTPPPHCTLSRIPLLSRAHLRWVAIQAPPVQSISVALRL